MSLVWHIVKKDFRRMWLPLGLWALVLLAKNRIGALALAHDGVNLNRWTGLAVLNGLQLGVEIFVNVILVAVLVQEDALVGTRMWWATRPVGGGRLLVAKMITVGLMFGVLPVVVALPWWLANDYGAGQIVRATCVTLDWQLLAVLPALLLAVLTETTLRFLGWLLGLAVATLVVGVTGSILFSDVTRIGPPVEVVSTRGVIAVGLIAAGFAGVIVWQFLKRRLAQAMTILAGMAALVLVVATCWPWSLLASDVPASAGSETASIELAQIKLHPPRDNDQSVTVDAWLRGVPGEFGVHGSMQNTWRWADGSAGANSNGLRGSWPGAAEWQALELPRENKSAALATWLHAGPEQPEEWTAAGAMRLRTQLYLRATDAARLSAESPAYVGAWQIRLQQPEREFELPLRQGERFAQAGDSVRIAALDWRDGALSIAVIASEPLLINDGRYRMGPVAITNDFANGRSEDRRGFALVNRARGDAVKLWELGRTVKFPVGTELIAWMSFTCRVPRDPDELPGRPPRWLEGATLAGVRYRDVGSFRREVKLDHFKMEPTNEQPR